MPARRRFWHQLQASKGEARLAVDLHNQSGSERRLEAFIVHMSLAWLKLLQAHYDETGREKELYRRDNRGRRTRSAEGDWLMKPLHRLLLETYADDNPVRRNVEFFLGLRHKIEHRVDRDVASLVAGKTQAIVLNYERQLVAWFGNEEGLADDLRFPVFLSSVTQDAVEALKAVRARTPRPILDYIQDFDATLDPEVAGSEAYDFRVVLVPQQGPKSEADVAMSFVRLEDLDPAHRDDVERALTIIREKQVPVSNLDSLLPGQVIECVARETALRFTQHDHTCCWRHYQVRPPSDSTTPERTKPEFCRWDGTFERYVYTEAWVAFLARKLKDPVEHETVICRAPTPVAAAAAP